MLQKINRKINRTTRCGHCGKSFLYIYDLECVPVGMTHYDLSCPFCQTRQSVPLQSVRRVEVLRGDRQQEIVELTLPEHPVGEIPPQTATHLGRE